MTVDPNEIHTALEKLQGVTLGELIAAARPPVLPSGELLFEEMEVLRAAVAIETAQRRRHQSNPTRLTITAIHGLKPTPSYGTTTICLKSLCRFGLMDEIGSRYTVTAAGKAASSI